MKLLVVLPCLFQVVTSTFCYSASTFAEQHTLISKTVVNNKIECNKLCALDDSCVAVSLLERDGKHHCALLGDKIVGNVCPKATEVFEKRKCAIDAGWIYIAEPQIKVADFNKMDGTRRSESHWPRAKKIKVKVNAGCSISIEFSDGTKNNFDEMGTFDRNVPHGFTSATSTCN